jgi:hypothetical protein
MNEAQSRRAIIMTYAGWTALSALRSGSPIKSRADIYPILAMVNFGAMLAPDAPAVLAAEFSDWHRAATSQIQAAKAMLVVGWATKLINVYLKTAAYVGDLGRPGLRELIHPPIDSGLWDGLERWIISREGPRNVTLLRKTHVVRQIKLIRDYATYESIIEGCREVAGQVPCRLIEVEQFWEGASAPPSPLPLLPTGR